MDKLRKEFPNVFIKPGEKLTHAEGEEMVIEIENNHPPINQRAYRIPLNKMKIVEEELKFMLENDIIEPSTSAWASPICLARKKDGKWRFCVDYRKFNDVTVKEAQVPSRIDDILNHFGGAQYFSTIDLYKAYWQILMAKESRKYTAFMTHKGHFQFKRMSFGLTNAPAWFQRFMMKVLQPFLNKFAMVYLDDIVVFSKTKEEHREHLRLVFQALEDYNLKVSAEKCFLFQDKIKILGFYASKDGITSDPEKVEAIKAMASPNNVKQVRRFLGMTGYYRRLIDDYGKISGPLMKLNRKFVKF